MSDAPDPQPARKRHIPRTVAMAGIVLLVLAAGAYAWFYFTTGPEDAVAAARDGDISKLRLILAVRPGLLDAEGDFDTPLLAAILEERAEVVTFLLDRGADPDAAAGLGVTPLGMALGCEDVDLARELIEHGANPDKSTRLAVPWSVNGPPILHAAMNGQSQILRLLLEAGADPNPRLLDPPGFDTPLHVAIAFDWPEEVEILLEHGAAVNPADPDIEPPLRVAVRVNKLKMVALLLKHGADIDIRDSTGATLLEEYAVEEREAVFKRLLEAGAEADPHFLLTVLGSLYADGWKRTVNDYLATWPNIDQPSKVKEARGGTLLHLAAGAGQEKLVELLLANRARANLPDKDGRTPLDWALARDQVQPKVVLGLLAAGGRGEARTVYDAIKLALAEGRKELLAPLLADDYLLNKERDTKGNGLLMYAVAEGEADLVDLLLASGARARTMNWQGESPLHAAVGAPRNAERMVAALLKAGADPNASDLYDRTALHRATMDGAPASMVRQLLAAGARPNALDYDKVTPLLRAAEREDIEQVKVLLKYKADVDRRGDKGYTPLHFAALANNVELVRVLLDGGANTRLRDDRHMLARVYAGQKGFKEVEAMILEIEPKHRFPDDHLPENQKRR